MVLIGVFTMVNIWFDFIGSRSTVQKLAIQSYFGTSDRVEWRTVEKHKKERRLGSAFVNRKRVETPSFDTMKEILTWTGEWF